MLTAFRDPVLLAFGKHQRIGAAGDVKLPGVWHFFEHLKVYVLTDLFDERIMDGVPFLPATAGQLAPNVLEEPARPLAECLARNLVRSILPKFSPIGQ